MTGRGRGRGRRQVAEPDPQAADNKGFSDQIYFGYNSSWDYLVNFPSSR